VLRKLFADADAPPASIEQCLESRLDGLDVRLARIEEQLIASVVDPRDDPFEDRIASRTGWRPISVG
jgi:hypothetical protein